MIEVKNFDGDVSVGRNAVVGGDAKVCGGMTVGKNLKVEGWLDAKNIKGSNKGLFVDEASLKKAYPVPRDGWWALVGDTMPAALWVANGGEWVTNGGTGGEITVESQQIEALIERFEEEMQSMRDVNEAQTNNIVALSNATNTNAAEIEAVKSKNAEQDELLAASVAADAAHDEEISALKSKDTTHDSRIKKLEERVLQYIYPKIYQLNEGAGALKFNGFTEAEGSGGLLLTKDTYKYNVLYSTTQKAFVLNVTDESSGSGVRVGTFNLWPKIEGKGIASSEGYAQRDCLYYIFVSGEGSTYYYIDSNGEATEKSATFLLRKLIDDLSANLDTAKASLNAKDAEQDRTIGAIQTKNTEQDGAIDSLEEKNDEQDTRIAALLQDTPWEGQHMNAFTETGEYRIHGDRTNANDGLPILNEGSGHTIEARLTVLDSSLTNGTGAKTDIVVTQILRLSNRTGGDGHVYVRTAQASTKSQLATPSSTAWGTWEKLMGVFEKNAVSNATDLNEYTSSGMYDGMFVFSSTSQTAVSGLKIENGSTFLMVSVNGYAVAQTGVVPQVTQLLYVMPSGLDGLSGVRNAKVYTRTGIYVATTKTYTWGKFDGLAYASDISKLASDIQDNSGLIQENQVAITANTEKISGVESTANAAKSAAETAQTAATTAQETANSARETATAASTAAQEAKTAAETAQETANEASMKISELSLVLGKTGVISQVQTWTQAADNGYDYVMSGLVRGVIPQANIDLFTSAGAIFNEGSGYFELNGLTDISYEEMLNIYNVYNPNPWNNQEGMLSVKNTRTFLPANNDIITVIPWYGFRLCYTLADIETIKIIDNGIPKFNNLQLAWFFNLKLKNIQNIIDVSTVTKYMQCFEKCYSLVDVRFMKIIASVSFKDCARLSNSSILYMINNEAATSPITITLHADVYNRCMANEDILAALEAHTNISLASA